MDAVIIATIVVFTISGLCLFCIICRSRVEHCVVRDLEKQISADSKNKIKTQQTMAESV